MWVREGESGGSGREWREWERVEGVGVGESGWRVGRDVVGMMEPTMGLEWPGSLWEE